MPGLGGRHSRSAVSEACECRQGGLQASVRVGHGELDQRLARVAGGREHNLRSLQPLALYPADSIFVNGYLTTPGQPAPEVWGMIEDLGFKIEVNYQQPVAG